jgi:hypothetical protein
MEEELDVMICQVVGFSCPWARYKAKFRPQGREATLWLASAFNQALAAKFTLPSIPTPLPTESTTPTSLRFCHFSTHCPDSPQHDYHLQALPGLAYFLHLCALVAVTST